MRSFFVGISCLIAFTVLAQKKETLLLQLNSLPVKQGMIYHTECFGYCMKYHTDGVIVENTSDSAFSVESGNVVSVFSLGFEWAIIMKNDTGTFFTYSGLKSTQVKKGAVIKKGDFLGQISNDEGGIRKLYFVITNSNAISWTEEKTVNFLKQLQLPCIELESRLISSR